MLRCIGQKGREIYETFTFEPCKSLVYFSSFLPIHVSKTEAFILPPVLEKFSEYCKSKKNKTILHPLFFTYRQKKSQNFHDFVTELKKLNSETEFDNFQDSLLKDMIACGTRDKFLHKRFF